MECVKTKPVYPIVGCRGRVCLPEDTKQTVFGRANLAPTNKMTVLSTFGHNPFLSIENYFLVLLF